MTTVIKLSPNLEEFLKLPETKPASEYINKEIIQKPMPQGEHSRLQGKFCTVINQKVREADLSRRELPFITQKQPLENRQY